VSTTYHDWLQQLKQQVPETTAKQLAASQNGATAPLILDVRERDEWQEGHVPGAQHLPRGFLELRIESVEPERARPIVVYCAGGVRSLFAAEALRKLGYQSVTSLEGGFGAWKDAGLDFSQPRVLTESDRRRYARHLSIPEVGEAGQLRLLDSKVLLVGAGGLGCPAAYYLAAAGVGTLGVVDNDVVDASNLQRQILHTEDRVGQPKVDSAATSLQALNSGVQVHKYEERLTSSNVDSIFAGYDVIVDGSDNFPTRYLVNDACVKHGLPNVHGSVYRFEGQATVFWPGKGPCYRCLYPEPPPPELAPSCAEAGVLGILPGVVGLLEAVETIKLLLGAGDPLVGRLLVYDALRASFRELKLKAHPNCSYCAAGTSFPGYIDYQHFCASSQT
jgi:molybdopterin/thiamine biosynthesis adenylyltransferase/rhodanese-related sulfurtransferase